MLRKLIKVLSVAMILPLTSLVAYPEIAAEGVYIATAAAFASYVSAERPALQGVSYIDGEDIFPSMISFSRSDISTYPASFQFFSSGSTAEALLARFAPPDILDKLRNEQIAPGDIVLDGIVRFDWLSDNSLTYYGGTSDFTGARIAFSFSIVVTGNLAGDGVVIEGDIILEGGEGRTISVAQGSTIMIDGEETGVGPAVFTLAMIGGEYGQVQRIS